MIHDGHHLLAISCLQLPPGHDAASTPDLDAVMSRARGELERKADRLWSEIGHTSQRPGLVNVESYHQYHMAYEARGVSQSCVLVGVCAGLVPAPAFVS